MDRIIFHEQESWALENTAEALADAIEELSGKKLSMLGSGASQMAGELYAWPRVFEGLFAFTARFAQTTKETARDEQRESIHDPHLPRFRSRRGAAVMLPNRISRRADRSGLRRSTIVRRFSHYLLHRS